MVEHELTSSLPFSPSLSCSNSTNDRADLEGRCVMTGDGSAVCEVSPLVSYHGEVSAPTGPI